MKEVTEGDKLPSEIVPKSFIVKYRFRSTKLILCRTIKFGEVKYKFCRFLFNKYENYHLRQRDFYQRNGSRGGGVKKIGV